MNKVLLTLLALSLIVASCKKESTKEDETKVTCQMTGATVKFSNNGFPSTSTYNYTYDDKGRITKAKDTYGDEMNYSYSSNQIIEESPLLTSYYYKGIYQLDASGKIVSAVMKYSHDGSNEISSLKYFYNSDGYLSEVQDTFEGGNIYTDFDKYYYTNGNLTSIVRTNNNSNGSGARTTTIAYNNDLAPSNFFTIYDREILNTGILKAYFGKASKNLISGIKDDRTTPDVSYTYQKNAEGNVNQMTETGNSGANIYGFTYTCK